jgi:hypothetical protein
MRDRSSWLESDPLKAANLKSSRVGNIYEDPSSYDDMKDFKQIMFKHMAGVLNIEDDLFCGK